MHKTRHITIHADPGDKITVLAEVATRIAQGTDDLVTLVFNDMYFFVTGRTTENILAEYDMRVNSYRPL